MVLVGEDMLMFCVIGMFGLIIEMLVFLGHMLLL